MSNLIGNWLDSSNVSNLYIQTYVKGFVDMSGGNLILRNSNIYVNNGDISLNGRLYTRSDVSLGGNLYVAGKTIHNGDISMNGNLVISGNLYVTQPATNINIVNTTVNNYQLVVTDDISLNGRLTVSQDSSFNGNVGIKGNVGFGTQTPQYPVDISGQMQIANASTSAVYNNFNGMTIPTTVYPSTIIPNTINATASSWTNNNVTWTASLSNTTGTNYAFKAFNATYSDSAASPNNSYNLTTGKYPGNTVTFNILNNSASQPFSLSGEWLQISSSIPLVMSSYQIATGGTAGQIGAKFSILGSNDANTWYTIQDCSFSGTTAPGSNASLLSGNVTVSTNATATPTIGTATLNISNQSSYSTRPYTNFRMVALTTFGGGTGGNFEIGEWPINFTLPSVTGPSKTIMYMDPSNINQLDISGSLGLINSNPTSTVTPCIFNFTVSGNIWKNNNVVWTASGSSFTTSKNAFNAFYANYPGTTSMFPWYSATGTYTSGVTNSATAGTLVSAQNISGEWLQIQSSVPVIMNGYTLGSDYASPFVFPATYTIAGSNDGSTWTKLQDCSFTAWPGNATSTTITYSQTTNYYPVSTATSTTVNNNTITINTTTAQTSSYTYFRLIVKSTCYGRFGATSIGTIAACFWYPLFSPATSSVSLALDNATPNQMNIGGSLNVNGSLAISNTQPIKGIVCGTVTTSSGSGSVNFGYTFYSPPIVTASIIASSSSAMISVQISSITTTGFSFVKNAFNTGNATLQVAAESFNWIAIGI